MKILFLTGTRADYGKLKILIDVVNDSDVYSASIFVTGMHMLSLYGSTHQEVSANHSANTEIYKFINQNLTSTMDEVLSKTVLGLSDFVKENNTDCIVIHGDRVETLAGVIVASLNNIPSVHIEGGEVSGTIDEMIRHSVSKLATYHGVSNEDARLRLMQMGEESHRISVIGSPDVDIMLSDTLPNIEEVKLHYGIEFKEYSILLFHPVTTEADQVAAQIQTVIEAAKRSNLKFLVIFPNNDLGSSAIIDAYGALPKNFRVIPSMRFEFFLTTLKECQLILGNSSAGVREAPYFGVPAINIGNRQNDRTDVASVFNVEFNEDIIMAHILQLSSKKFVPVESFGSNGTAGRFMGLLNSVNQGAGVQKYFKNTERQGNDKR